MAQKKQSTTGASRDGIAARLAALPAKSPARQLGVSTIIARAKARRPAQAAAVIDGTFQRLGVQFPKTADLLMAAARLPGIADRYRWIETTAGARLAPLADLGLLQTGPRHPDHLIVIGIRLPGRLDVGVAATVATYADDKSAHLALNRHRSGRIGYQAQAGISGPCQSTPAGIPWPSGTGRCKFTDRASDTLQFPRDRARS